jgi:hypothetical protein
MMVQSYATRPSSPPAPKPQSNALAGSPFYVGAWALSRTGYPSLGWFEDAEVLRFWRDLTVLLYDPSGPPSGCTKAGLEGRRDG